jgi:hypothetical protein
LEIKKGKLKRTRGKTLEPVKVIYLARTRYLKLGGC